MPEFDSKEDEEEVIQMALQALREANERAKKSGRELVFVRNGELVRSGPNGITVLRKLPPRRKVNGRIRRAQS
jgi:20S proteasome alpha/beta subunit